RAGRPAWDEQTVASHGEHDLTAGAELVEQVQDRDDRLPHGLVGVHHDVPVIVVDEAHGQALAQLALGGLVTEAAVRRWRIRCNSASLIVPLRPSTRRSLKSPGW